MAVSTRASASLYSVRSSCTCGGGGVSAVLGGGSIATTAGGENDNEATSSEAGIIASFTLASNVAAQQERLRRHVELSGLLVERQLSAGGLDVVATRRPQPALDPGLAQNRDEALDPTIARPPVGGVRVGVEGDHVDVTAKLADQPDQPAGVGVAVVDLAEQHVLEGHSPSAGGRHLADRREQLGDVPAPVDRHDLVADLVGRGVEADRQTDLEPEALAGEALDGRDQAGGRDRDPAPG